MANKKITGLPLATTPLSGSEEMEIIQNGLNKRVAVEEAGNTIDPYTYPFPQFTTATSTTAYTGTTSPAITAYATGQKFQVKVHATSTGASTLNLNALGAKKVFTNPTTQATTGDLLINQIYLMVYDAALDTAAGGFLILGMASGTGWLTEGTTTLLGTGAYIDFTGKDLTFNGDEATIDFGPTPNGILMSANVFKAGVPGDGAYIQISGTSQADILVTANDDITITAGSSGNAHNINITSAYGQVNITGGEGVHITSTSVALTDAATMDIISNKHTLTTSSATRTFTQTYAGDLSVIIVTLNAVASVFTFPAGALCVSEGVASGDNTASLAGVSGDKYVIEVRKFSAAYYVTVKNFGQ